MIGHQMHTCKKMMNQSGTDRSLQDYYISCVSNGETKGVQYGIDMAWSKNVFPLYCSGDTLTY